MVERHVRDVEAAGSNPVTSTNIPNSPVDCWGYYQEAASVSPMPSKALYELQVAEIAKVSRNRQSNFANAELSLVTSTKYKRTVIWLYV